MQLSHFVTADGYEWIQRASKLYGTYETCAAYAGKSPSSMPAFVFRNNLKTIQHGRKKLVSKDDLDRVDGVLAA